MADEPTTALEPAPEPAPAADPPPADPPKSAEPPPAEPPPADPPKEPTPEPASWRDTLPDDLKSHAERFPDVAALVRANVDARKQLSTAIIPPGKDAKPEEIAAYNKKMGIPESPDGYKVARPEHMPEEVFKSEAVQGNLKTVLARLHEAGFPAQHVKAALDAYWDVEAASLQAVQDADKQFAKEADEALHKAWPGKEYTENKEHAERAAVQMFGEQLDEFRVLETKDGKLVADHPVVLRALAAVGRQMQAAGIVPPLSADDAANVETELTEIRAKIAAAQREGNSKRANELYKQEQEMLAKTRGNAPVVGAQGRAA